MSFIDDMEKWSRKIAGIAALPVILVGAQYTILTQTEITFVTKLAILLNTAISSFALVAAIAAHGGEGKV